MNPKINTMFLPQVEEVVYKYFGIEKPNKNNDEVDGMKVEPLSEDLLPEDLEAVSPESVHAEKKEELDDSHNTEDMKMEEDESPPFEPLEEQSNLMIQEENSVDSHLSGFSGMASHESNNSSDTKGLQIDLSNQDSQMSRNSSESHLSIVTSDDNTKMEVSEDSQSKSLKPNENTKTENAEESKKPEQTNSKPKTDEKKSRSSDKSSDKSRSRSEKDRRDDKERRSSSSKHSSSRDKDRDRKDSKSSSSRSDKDRYRSKHSSSSNRDKSDSRKDSKDRDKSRSSNSSTHKDAKSKSSYNDSKSKSSSSSSHKKHEKSLSAPHNSRHSSSSSSNSSSKRDKKDAKKEKDDHYSSKDKKIDRRSTDRDSNDGQSGKHASSGTNNENSSKSQGKHTNETNESSNTGHSGESGNSDAVQGKAPIEVEVNDSEIAISSQKVKLNKPKFASNMREAMKLMKIRKQLKLLEKQNQLSLLSETESKPNGDEKAVPNNEKSPTVLTKENWDALEARLYEEMSNISNSYGDTSEERSDTEDFSMEETNSCKYLEEAPERLEKKKEFLNEYVDKLQRDIDDKHKTSERLNKKRKTDEQADAKNNNKMNDSEDAGNLKKRVKRKSTTTISGNIFLNTFKTNLINCCLDVPNESFPLPLSPAESDASSDKKEESLDGKSKKTVNRGLC